MTNRHRDSNMELARIVAMAMILIYHFAFHGVQWMHPSPLEIPRLGAFELTNFIVISMFVAGSDLFMMISGYYGIRLRWKSLLSFWLLCIFYNAVNLFVNNSADAIGAKEIVDIFLISKTGNWFFRCYFWVMLASPIINLALNKLELKALRILAAAGLVLTCISSWRFANPDGNTPELLMVLYFWGGYLRRETALTGFSKGKALAVFAAACLTLIASGVIAYNVFHKEYGIFVQHNSIFVVAMAAALLLFFRECNLKSRFINLWASTVVAALFIQDVILYGPIYRFVHDLAMKEGQCAHLWLTVLGLTAAIFIAAFIIEWPRKKIAGVLADRGSDWLDRVFDLGKALGND